MIDREAVARDIARTQYVLFHPLNAPIDEDLVDLATVAVGQDLAIFFDELEVAREALHVEPCGRSVGHRRAIEATDAHLAAIGAVKEGR